MGCPHGGAMERLRKEEGQKRAPNTHQPYKYNLIVKWTTGKAISVNQKKRSEIHITTELEGHQLPWLLPTQPVPPDTRNDVHNTN